jgi:raffinose/stachyose/melibiose transport system substrate-binding protein
MFKSRKFSNLILIVVALCMTTRVVIAQDLPTVSVWFGSGSEPNCGLPILTEGFNSTSQTARVEIIEQPEAWDVTRTAVTGGGGPDVVISPGPSFVYEMAAANLILPLTDYADQLGWTETFVPWALSLGSVDGTLYSLPSELETLILYYNKTLFEQNGWQPPTTMDELVALSEQISAAGIEPFAHGNADWRPTNEWFVGEFLNHIAGPQAVYEALRGERPWTDEAFANAIDALNTMQANGWFFGGLDLYYTADEPTRMAALGAGEAAMNIEGTWRFGTIDNYFGEAAGNANEWDWVPVPSTTGDAIFDIGIGSTWSINAASPHPDAAAEFLTYYFSPEVQANLLVSCGGSAAPVNLKADALDGIDPRIARAFETIAESSNAGNYGYTTWTFWPPKSDAYIYEEIERVWDGQITTAEYLEGLNTIFAEELAAGDIPPIPER